MTSVHYSYAQTAANEFSTLFDGERVFSHPKPVNDIKSLIAYLSNTDDLIVDFCWLRHIWAFSFLQNAKDHVNRRFILVQLPEPFNHKNKEQEIAYNFCERMGTPKNIAEITKERLRRAGKKVSEDNPDWNGDIGFRVFKLDTSNIRPWEATAESLSLQLDAYISPIIEGRSEKTYLLN